MQPSWWGCVARIGPRRKWCIAAAPTSLRHRSCGLEAPGVQRGLICRCAAGWTPTSGDMGA